MLVLSSIGKRLIARIPQYYEKDGFSLAWFDSISKEIENLETANKQFIDSAHVQNSDEEIISIYENDWGIENEITADLEARIGRVLGKIFIRYNTFNEKNINKLSIILGMGAVQVIFTPQFGSVDLIIQNPGESTDDNFRYFTELTDIWIPAHLTVTSVQPELTWDEAETQLITYDDMENNLQYRWFTTPPTE
jgi:hypothetical protein